MPIRSLTIPPCLLVALLTGATAQHAAAGPDPVPCLIEPEALVQLSTATAGIVAEVHAERGDSVRAGAVLARLDSQLEEIALALARARAGNTTRVRSLEARVAFLEGQAARAAELATRSAVAGTAVLEAEMEAEMARQDLAEAQLTFDLSALEVAQAEAALAQKEVRAPFDGIVTERLLSVGEYRDGQAHILTLARLDMLRVEAFAPLSAYPQVALGQAVTVRPEAPVGGDYAGTITVIDRVFDAASGTFGLRVALPNPDLALPAGLRCDLVFDTAPGGG